MEQKDNRRFYDAGRAVPDFAKKPIKGGRLNGMTNVSPMFRIEKLTELFGPCGIGWKLENIQYWTAEGAGECVVLCSLDIRYCENGQWSEPVNGIGGSKLYGKGVGDGINDEAYKMAQTDAISVACKNLGIAADVYYGLDDTKYKAEGNYGWASQPPQPQQQPKNVPSLDAVIQLAVNAKSPEELTGIWNAHKAVYGKNTAFKKAIADNPNNPNKK